LIALVTALATVVVLTAVMLVLPSQCQEGNRLGPARQ
jgi:hypothetical protein